MTYHFSKTVPMNFQEAVDKVTSELKARGFGILTQIDVCQTLKAELDVEFRPYLILGRAIRRSPTRPCRPRTRSERCCRATSSFSSMPTVRSKCRQSTR